MLLLAFTPILLACGMGKHRSDAETATVFEAVTPTDNKGGDTLGVDLAASTVNWKATKMRGTRKHEGNIQFESAYLLTEDGQITGGRFVVNMNTIDVTDIPAHEAEPKQNLIDHLKSNDFFDVEKYPAATFEITDLDHLTVDSLKVTGNLNIKGVTRSIRFGALNKDNTFSANFTFDRFLWDITFKGNLAERTLVDRPISLVIDLKTEN